MDTRLRITAFKDSEASFRETLNEHEIINGRVMQFSEAPMAAGILIEIVLNGGWGAFAVAIIAWANARKSRRINIITKDNETIWLEGYSAKDAEKVLASAKNISVIETSPENEKT